MAIMIHYRYLNFPMHIATIHIREPNRSIRIYFIGPFKMATTTSNFDESTLTSSKVLVNSVTKRLFSFIFAIYTISPNVSVMEDPTHLIQYLCDKIVSLVGKRHL